MESTNIKTIPDLKAYIHFRYAKGDTASQMFDQVRKVIGSQLPYPVFRQLPGDFSYDKTEKLLFELAPKVPIDPPKEPSTPGPSIPNFDSMQQALVWLLKKSFEGPVSSSTIVTLLDHNIPYDCYTKVPGRSVTDKALTVSLWLQQVERLLGEQPKQPSAVPDTSKVPTRKEFWDIDTIAVIFGHNI